MAVGSGRRRATVEVESIAAGGDGIARAEGLVVFLPRTAPGDVGVAEFELRGRLARGRLVELERPSPHRVEPPCPHYTADRCGGCQLQHLAYPAQLEAKGRIVADALARIARRPLDAAPEVRAAGEPWRYRRKLTLALRWRDGRWIAGLHPYDPPGRIFALGDCPITDERVVAVWRQLLAAAEWLPRVPELRGAVRLLGDGAAFVLEGARRWPTAGRLFEAVPALSALWWEPEGGTRRLLHDRRTEAVPGASFVQVNPAVAAALAGHVVARVLAHEPATVVDLYAGAGDVAVELAGRGARVQAVELDAEAAAWAASRLPAGSAAHAGRAEELLPGLLPADVVILNPPRAGVDERVTAALGAAPPRAVLYVSCNPATLARDLGRLPAFRVASVVAFDMFPQTAHVETVCELVPEAA
jgi:23S rRNA (uracil1939-C5)-methyltransferase